VEPGEDDRAALRREVQEESGYAVSGTPSLTLVVDELRAGQEPGTLLRMSNRYYATEVGAAGHQELEPDEAELGLAPAWLTIDEALALQERHADGPAPRPWAARELAVLRWLASGPGIRPTRPGTRA
jgi:8-oxo-dGTP pyrophosphatase MutT (NUDIX family)